MQALISRELLIKAEAEENIFHHVIAFPRKLQSIQSPSRNDYFI